MNDLERASSALVTLLGKIDTCAPGDHRANALGSLAELLAAERNDAWIHDAIGELWRGRSRTELRACVARCIGQVAVAMEAETTRRRATLLPPPSGERNELSLEKEAAARASLASVDLAVNVLGREEVVPAYSTVPASATWFTEVA